MSSAYIILTNSNSSLIKQFRVIADSYQDREEVIETRQFTITGKTDMQVGPAKRTYTYDLLVWETDPTDSTKADADTTGYGRIDHLETFYRYRVPSATPSNLITLTDHNGGTHAVYMRGNLIKKPLGALISGICAVYLVYVIFEETD